MGKRKKQMFLALGCLAYIIVCPIIIYFGSTLIACAFSISPAHTSVVLGIIIVLLTGILIYYFRPIQDWEQLCMVPIFMAFFVSLLMYYRFDEVSFRNGYLHYKNGYDHYYYDMFGREVFSGSEEEWEIYDVSINNS